MSNSKLRLETHVGNSTTPACWADLPVPPHRLMPGTTPAFTLIYYKIFLNALNFYY